MKFIVFILLTTSFLNAEGLGIPNPLYELKNQIKSKNSQKFSQKKFGIEVNPLYILLLHREEQLLSGSFSYFDHKNNIEYTFPVHYYKHDEHDYSDYEQYTIDLHYRKFLEDRVGGIYISGFTRIAHLEGALYEDYKLAKQTKVGFGGGVGYRYFSNRGFYWGASLSLGTYVGSNRDLEYDGSTFFMGDDRVFIVDIELFKFGWAF